MATATHICTLDHVAQMLGEDPERLETIVHTDDSLTCGSIIGVHGGPDETITALTDDGIDEPKGMLGDARLTTRTGHAFPDDSVDDAQLVTLIQTQSLRSQPGGTPDRHPRPADREAQPPDRRADCAEPRAHGPHRAPPRRAGRRPAVLAIPLGELPELGLLDRCTIAAIAGLAPHLRESGIRRGTRRIRGGRRKAPEALSIAAPSACRRVPVLVPGAKGCAPPQRLPRPSPSPSGASSPSSSTRDDDRTKPRGAPENTVTP